MSDADSFIREVSEEVRRDRLFGLWRRYGPFVVGGVVAIVLVTAGLQVWEGRETAAAREAGAVILEAQAADSAARRAGDLMLAVDALEDGPARLARLSAAAAAAAAGRAAEAAELYDAIAVDSGSSDAVAAFAAYRAALLRAPEAGPQATAAALEPLIGPEAPFRLLALEARAVMLARLGDAEAAVAALDAILADATATEGMRLRAAELRAALGAPPAAG